MPLDFPLLVWQVAITEVVAVIQVVIIMIM